jgi:dethiobiotin synthetase
MEGSYVSIEFPAHIFIAGTDTEVGKTLVAAILMAGLTAAYWKPVQSGDALGTDTKWIRKHTDLPNHHFLKETYRFREAISPHAAAALEGIDINLEAFRLPSYDPFDHLIIEGAGGLMAPLNRNSFMIDLIKRLQAPVLLVAKSGLGTINHTLLSLGKLRQEGITILGVVMNGPPNDTNRSAIEHFGKVRVWGEVPPMKEITPLSLKEAFFAYFK